MSTVPKEKLDKLIERWTAIQSELNEGVNQERYAKLTKEFSALNPIVTTIDALRVVQKERADLEALIGDPTVDKEMSNNVSPMAKQVCAKQEIKKTATGYVSDSECSVAGVSTTSHAEITGDFNSAYTVKTTSHAKGGVAGAAGRDGTMTLQAKWLGACKPDQKPGDIVMPGGFKMNVRDMDKLKALLPK